MKKDELIELRDRELSNYYEEFMDAPGNLRSEALPVPPKTAQRLAIGGRYRGNDNYDLVIRVQSKAGRAATRAKQLMENVRKDFGEDQHIDFGVVRRISTPSQKAVAEFGNKCTYGNKHMRPLRIGCSIGHRDGPPGTLGLFVSAPDGVAALSCNHVIARANEANVGDWMYQPGPPDQPADSQNRIGKLAHFRELTRIGSNTIDAAYCILEDEIEIEENLIPSSKGVPNGGRKISSYIDPWDLKESGRIAKIGRCSGYTSEPVRKVSVGISDVSIEVPGLGNHRFDNMVEIEWSTRRKPFARPGDSGSVLYHEGNLEAFAIHVASGEIDKEIRGRVRRRAVSYACPINVIMDSYGLSML